MKTVYHYADAILCGLGEDTNVILDKIMAGQSGLALKAFDNNLKYPVASLTAAQNQNLQEKYSQSYTRFEQMCLSVIEHTLSQHSIPIQSEECIIILSSTKGNIAHINNPDFNIALHQSAAKIGKHFQNPNQVITVSVACISGVAAQIMAKRLLEDNAYKYAVIVACDELSSFVVAGFHSFQALANNQCIPFDKDRKGLNLGEAAACLILTNDESLSQKSMAVLKGGAITNDANHLSGPSKTGEELGEAIMQTLKEASVEAKNVDFVSAHGTATNYNDEMEAKAIHHAHITAPTNSLKSYFGHTLGAAGLLETIIGLHAMQSNTLIPILNFNETNVSKPLSIIKEKKQIEIHNFVKTAAGFGGCNAAILWQKI